MLFRSPSDEYMVLPKSFSLINLMHFQYYEMSYGLNVEMHKQTEICKRLDAIIRQVLPFLNGEHQQQVAVAIERAKQITMTELTALMQVITIFLVRIIIISVSPIPASSSDWAD